MLKWTWGLTRKDKNNLKKYNDEQLGVDKMRENIDDMNAFKSNQWNLYK